MLVAVRARDLRRALQRAADKVAGPGGTLEKGGGDVVGSNNIVPTTTRGALCTHMWVCTRLCGSQRVGKVISYLSLCETLSSLVCKTAF